MLMSAYMCTGGGEFPWSFDKKTLLLELTRTQPLIGLYTGLIYISIFLLHPCVLYNGPFFHHSVYCYKIKCRLSMYSNTVY